MSEAFHQVQMHMTVRVEPRNRYDNSVLYPMHLDNRGFAVIILVHWKFHKNEQQLSTA